MSDKNQMLKTFLQNCTDHNGMFLFATAAIGWALASAAQTVSLITNKEIPKEEKKFLIPQEILDGTFNILTYAVISLPLMFGAKKLAGNHAAKINMNDSGKFIEGANTLAAVVGGVISSNIVTPVLRNKYGVLLQDKFAGNNKKQDELNQDNLEDKNPKAKLDINQTQIADSDNTSSKLDVVSPSVSLPSSSSIPFSSNIRSAQGYIAFAKNLNSYNSGSLKI